MWLQIGLIGTLTLRFGMNVRGVRPFTVGVDAAAFDPPRATFATPLFKASSIWAACFEADDVIALARGAAMLVAA